MKETRTNLMMDGLVEMYGKPQLDYFYDALYGSSWRIWFQEWHQHTDTGMHDSFAAQGNSLEKAIARIADGIAKYGMPIAGMHCRKGCPHYSGDAI